VRLCWMKRFRKAYLIFVTGVAGLSLERAGFQRASLKKLGVDVSGLCLSVKVM